MDNKTKASFVKLINKVDEIGVELRAKAEKYFTANPKLSIRRGKGVVEVDFVGVEGEGPQCRIKVKNEKTSKEYNVNLEKLVSEK